MGVCARRGIDPLALARACLRGGARVLQVRHKRDESGAFLELARAVVAAAARFDATVIVNDRADIARLAKAGGVHVGQDDLDVDHARQVAGDAAIVGLSTHERHQVDAALSGTADYVAVGPIYRTTTKDTGYTARGLELVHYAAGRGKPVVAIGGVTLGRVRELVAAGAAGLAVISDLFAGDAEMRVRGYLDVLRI